MNVPGYIYFANGECDKVHLQFDLDDNEQYNIPIRLTIKINNQHTHYDLCFKLPIFQKNEAYKLFNQMMTKVYTMFVQDINKTNEFIQSDLILFLI